MIQITFEESIDNFFKTNLNPGQQYPYNQGEANTITDAVTYAVTEANYVLMYQDSSTGTMIIYHDIFRSKIDQKYMIVTKWKHLRGIEYEIQTVYVDTLVESFIELLKWNKYTYNTVGILIDSLGLGEYLDDGNSIDDLIDAIQLDPDKIHAINDTRY